MRLPRLSGSSLAFAILLGGAVLWIGSGLATREPLAPPPPAERPPPLVAVSWSEAQAVERLLTLYGEVEPDQVVQVRAQTAGEVAERQVALGDVVEHGRVLAQLGLDDRPARLRRAQANLENMQREFNAAQQLLDRGSGTVARRDAARADLEAARSDLAAIEREIELTTIRAPIEGVVNRLLADVGDYVAVGGEVVEIVDNDPLRVVVHVPQRAVQRLTPGGEARVRLIGGEPVEGRIRFIAPIAEAATRTFRVEIEVENPDRSLPSGISAEVVIPTEEVTAHRLSPALISLDDSGRIGVHAVDETEHVVFHPIQVVRTEVDGVYVDGLPDRVRLITIRPGHVSAGQAVETQETPAEYRNVAAPGG